VAAVASIAAFAIDLILKYEVIRSAPKKYLTSFLNFPSLGDGIPVA
jgi:hypothetical protein